MLNATISSGFAPYESHSLSHVTLAALSVSLLLGLGTSYAYFFSSGNNPNKIHELGGLSIANAWTFFNKRYDFLRSNFEKTGQDLFSFKVLHVSLRLCNRVSHNKCVAFQHQVVAMSGDEARKMFFNEKGLDFVQGYKLLMGGVSQVLEPQGLVLN